MSKSADALALRQMAEAQYNKGHFLTIEILNRVASQLESDVGRDEKYEALQAIGKSAAESLAEMVAALECDYDRLEELAEERDTAESDSPGMWAILAMYKDSREELADLIAAAGECTSREEAGERIQQDPLSLLVRSGWYAPGGDSSAKEFELLLGTGGPAVRIIGELGNNGEPDRARLQAQDWGTPWTDYMGDAISRDDLLTYCRCFYFGEG
jgi:hypothetical protein